MSEIKLIKLFCETKDTKYLSKLQKETQIFFKKSSVIAMTKKNGNKELAKVVLKYFQKTKVVNVKVAYIRPKYKNLKEWDKDPANVYIGRRGIVFIKNEHDGKERFPKKDSIWHNPFKINKTTTREEVVDQYREYIVAKIRKENLGSELQKLKGKNLGCWCYPEACHGDVLADLIG